MFRGRIRARRAASFVIGGPPACFDGCSGGAVDPSLITSLVAYLNRIRPDDAPALIDPGVQPDYRTFSSYTRGKSFDVLVLGSPRMSRNVFRCCSQRQILDQVVQMVSNKPSHVLIAKRSTNGRGNVFTCNTIRTHLQNRS